MSFDPTALPQVNFSGTPNFRPLGDDTLSPLVKPGMGKRCVPLAFNWLVYFTAALKPDIAVPINLSGGNNVGGLLDKIRAVKIDNTNSLVPVTVFFPDSGDLLTCAPDTVTQGPVVTNDAKCFVIAQGLQAGDTPKTTVFLYNFYLPPSSDTQVQLVFPQWSGSPNVQRATALTPGFAAPALGDQIQQFIHPLSVNGQVFQDQLFNGPGADFIYVTGIDVTAFGGTNVAATFFGSISAAIEGVLLEFGNGASPLNVAVAQAFPIHRTPGHMNLRLRGDDIWNFNLACIGAAAFASVSFIITYTRNPN